MSKIDDLMKLPGVEVVGDNVIHFDGKERVFLARAVEGNVMITPEGEAAYAALGDAPVAPKATRRAARAAESEAPAPSAPLTSAEIDELLK